MSLDLPIWIIGVTIMGLMIVTAEIGYHTGRRNKACESAVSAVKASVLALVGLMLAFSYSISAGHYDRRVQVVIGEAKALKTCWLRAELADEPARSRARDVLESMAHTRLVMVERGHDVQADMLAEAELAGFKRDLWTLAVGQLDQSTEPEKHVLFVQAVNDVIDRSGERIAAAADRVPGPVMLLLIAIILAAGFLIGLSSGQDDRRVPSLWAMVIVLLVTVLTMIFDLDNPNRGYIMDRYHPLEEVKKGMMAAEGH